MSSPGASVTPLESSGGYQFGQGVGVGVAKADIDQQDCDRDGDPARARPDRNSAAIAGVARPKWHERGAGAGTRVGRKDIELTAGAAPITQFFVAAPAAWLYLLQSAAPRPSGARLTAPIPRSPSA